MVSASTISSGTASATRAGDAQYVVRFDPSLERVTEGCGEGDGNPYAVEPCPFHEPPASRVASSTLVFWLRLANVSVIGKAYLTSSTPASTARS